MPLSAVDGVSHATNARFDRDSAWCNGWLYRLIGKLIGEQSWGVNA